MPVTGAPAAASALRAISAARGVGDGVKILASTAAAADYRAKRDETKGISRRMPRIPRKRDRGLGLPPPLLARTPRGGAPWHMDEAVQQAIDELDVEVQQNCDREHIVRCLRQLGACRVKDLRTMLDTMDGMLLVIKELEPTPPMFVYTLRDVVRISTSGASGGSSSSGAPSSSASTSTPASASSAVPPPPPPPPPSPAASVVVTVKMGMNTVVSARITGRGGRSPTAV